VTFDDGPSAGTPRILDELKAAGATATFFVVGSRLADRADLVARIAADGHEVGSHSWSHGRPGRSRAAFLWELARTSFAIRRAAGEIPHCFRPPYAKWTPRLVQAARLAGMRTVAWDVDSRDWESDDPAEVVERVMRSARPGSIVLLHEGTREVTIDALPSILDNLSAQGLATVTVSSLLTSA
jgi:peptidoglycan/xylan/chitin deacetylase (PgdA/CDA1 family)